MFSESARLDRLQDSPDAHRYLLYFFFAYAFVNFFIFILQAPPGTDPKGQNPAIEWRGFSGHWMVFYCASFVILSSALPARNP